MTAKIRRCLTANRFYRKICAYSSLWIHGAYGEVDHFVPKTVNPYQAYEWHNFRLCRKVINSWKYTFCDILDPFSIEDGWFVLDLNTLRINPNPDLLAETKKSVLITIKRLGLNKDLIIDAREDSIGRYGGSRKMLKKRAPFIAFELERQIKSEKERSQFIKQIIERLEKQD